VAVLKQAALGLPGSDLIRHPATSTQIFLQVLLCRSYVRAGWRGNRQSG